jgi:DNA-binding beta-propeller fold protein YncE
MHKDITRVGVSALAAVALSGLGVTGAGASGPAAKAAGPALVQSAKTAHASATPGAQLWASRYDGPAHGDDEAFSVAVSPDGGTVFVIGNSTGTGTGLDYATAAYNTTTGTQLWATRYNGPGNGDDYGQSIAVSPAGDTVFVTGQSTGTGTGFDYATVGYNAATGAQLWVKRYNGPGNGYDSAASVSVSPAGDKVFVTGQSQGATSPDYATVGYNAATGAKLWAKRYNGPAKSLDAATFVAVSPGGGTVFVTGFSTGIGTGLDYATVAYTAATGAQRWVKRYNGPGNSVDLASSVAVSPDGKTVVVTGRTTSIFTGGSSKGLDYATIAYNAATGAQRWVKRYNGPGKDADYAFSVAVSPAGDKVFVTGFSTGTSTGLDYATIAYNTATGAKLWAKRYNGPANSQDGGYSLAVSPDGGTVYVTGESTVTTTPDPASGQDYTTLAYSTATGAQLWASTYNGPGNGQDFAISVAVSPAGDKVFVTGESAGTSSGPDYATVAYSG